MPSMGERSLECRCRSWIARPETAHGRSSVARARSPTARSSDIRWCTGPTRSLAQLAVTRVEVRIPGLIEFLWGPTFSADGKAHVGLGGRSLETKKSEERTVEVDGAELRFAVGTRQASSWHSVQLQREAVAQVRLEGALPFDQVRQSWIQPLERLVGFAVRRRSLAVSASRFWRTAGLSTSSNISTGRIGIQSFARIATRELRGPSGDSFEPFIRRWWQLEAEMEGVADFMFGAMGPGRTLEPQLTALASVIEGYHRTFHDAPAINPEQHAKTYVPAMLAAVQDTVHRALYRKRLAHAHEMTQRAAGVVPRAGGEVIPELGRGRERLANAVVATRNYFTHLAKRTPHVLEGVHLLNANQLLTLAIECNLLVDLGVRPEAASKGVQRAYIGKFFFRDLQQRGAAWPESSGWSHKPRATTPAAVALRAGVDTCAVRRGRLTS